MERELLGGQDPEAGPQGTCQVKGVGDKIESQLYANIITAYLEAGIFFLWMSILCTSCMYEWKEYTFIV